MCHLFDKMARWPDEAARRRRQGFEDFEYPGAGEALDLLPGNPDLIHLHNLHTNYFDLRTLPRLSEIAPVALTMHDTWLLSGSCAYARCCEGWKSGCGICPDEMMPPVIDRPATKDNWKVKNEIYRKTRLYVAAPSQWLLDQVRDSMLMQSVVESRVIHNGRDLTDFQPGDRVAARRKLGLPENASVLLFVAVHVRSNPWKDWTTVRKSAESLARRMPEEPILFLGLGEKAREERLGKTRIQTKPYLSDPKEVALHYQAADLFLHAAKADTFPNAVIESLACGTPVVATRIGGIPEQIRALAPPTAKDLEKNPCSEDQATGALAAPGDAEGMAAAAQWLLERKDLLARLGENAARDARKRFHLERMVEDYLAWFDHILKREKSGEND